MNSSSRLLMFVVGLSCFAAVLSGCKEADALPLIGVTGDVVNENGPVAGAWIEFHPDEGRMSSAMTDEQGKFQLRYTLDHEGAIPGPHVVHFHLPPAKVPVAPSHYNEREQQEFRERNSQPSKIPYEERVEVTRSSQQFYCPHNGSKTLAFRRNLQVLRCVATI